VSRAAVKARRTARAVAHPANDFDAHEVLVRARLERLSEKRDTPHRRVVREALAERELAQRYAEGFGATIGDGIPVDGMADGVYVSKIADELPLFVWLRELLSTLTFADVTTEYAPTDEPPASARLIRVQKGYAVASLLVVDRDLDGEPDGLYHVWVAGRHRGQGIARHLVETARERWPISCIVGPLNRERGAARFAAAVASDLPVSRRD
jgi:ribosomal protein S18 acetylase RimI-like enzyme